VQFCNLFGSLKIILAAASGSVAEVAEDQPGEHYNSPVWIKQALERGVV